MKNLIIAAVGDNSLHHNWIQGIPNFDLSLIYFGKNSDIAKKYSQEAKYFKNQSGQKFPLIKSFLLENPNILKTYNFVWMPDDDIFISTEEINTLFDIACSYKLDLCQPGMKGYFSHKFTKPELFTFLRYTNFVEVLAPLMSIKTLINLYESFDISKSGWGLEFYWENIISKNDGKIAIIDSVVMHHTKPIGIDYSRFDIHPRIELENINNKYNLNLNLINFKLNFKVYKRVLKLFR